MVARTPPGTGSVARGERRSRAAVPSRASVPSRSRSARIASGSGPWYAGPRPRRRESARPAPASVPVGCVPTIGGSSSALRLIGRRLRRSAGEPTASSWSIGEAPARSTRPAMALLARRSDATRRCSTAGSGDDSCSSGCGVVVFGDRRRQHAAEATRSEHRRGAHAPAAATGPAPVGWRGSR